MRLPSLPESWFDRQRGHLFGWVPVCLAAGIGAYFMLPSELGRDQALTLVAAGLCAIGLGLWRPARIGTLAVAAGLIALGLAWAAVRANMVGEPVLSFRYYGPVEGRIVGIDRSASGAERWTLDRVVLEDLSPDRTPARIRVSVHGDGPHVVAEPGMVVILTAHLSPPPGPVEPGGFDFARMAWFDRLGAVGYTRTPTLMLSPAEEGAAGLALFRLRRALSLGVQSAMPDETAGVAAALMTGDRSAIPETVLEDLRVSNLAHLLAISGLHMGLLVGTVFAAVRVGCALVPALALRLPVKKIAALVALCAGAGYLALSGGAVATERAFIMVAVMLGAVLLDRRALTLRAVAIAALIVLALRPDALTGPGFQMSFAATTALVAVFGAMRRVEAEWIPRWARPVLAVFVSSLVAGLATAPFAAAHFNRVPHYGLIANLLSVPVMGMVVAPAAVLAAVLAPLGLASVGLWVMDLGLRWILGVAHWVAGLPSAVSHVVAPAPAVLPILTLGALIVILWRGPGRWAGLAPAALALILWSGTERPVLLVSDTGGLVGLMQADGRVLSKARGESFAAESWLENDGVPTRQDEAFARPGLSGGERRIAFDLNGMPMLAVRGKTELERLTDCDGAAVLISNTTVPGPRTCRVVDPVTLRQSGALAAYAKDGSLDFVSVRDVTGERLWNGGALPWW
ncbi:MAG: competence protein ComEC [Rhodobacteraceae bacterium HLUCCA08]|nr:MAG: competence protein ComEC [Rhodobacteraceae bacterium HLUCCA08]